METLLLPGMDGTGRLFGSLQQALGASFRTRVIAFPPDQPRSYDQLLTDIPVSPKPFALVAESFSGPIAIRLTARYPERIAALILAATFVRCPSRIAQWTHQSMSRRLFQMKAPDWALRWALLGSDASDQDIAELRTALATVDPNVLAQRLREVATVNVSDDFARITTPILYIAGRRDRLVSSRMTALMKRLQPEMKTCELDAPHMVLQQNASEAAQLIAAFIRAHAKGAPST